LEALVQPGHFCLEGAGVDALSVVQRLDDALVHLVFALQHGLVVEGSKEKSLVLVQLLLEELLVTDRTEAVQKSLCLVQPLRNLRLSGLERLVLHQNLVKQVELGGDECADSN